VEGVAAVPISVALADARHAGLTVAQVSERTRIRQTIIAGIECDDYSARGGDFYARGHIRAIAKVAGVDPELLIQEFDSTHRGAETSRNKLTPPRRPPPRRPTARQRP
jgi:cytoskeletal protein RodZ